MEDTFQLGQIPQVKEPKAKTIFRKREAKEEEPGRFKFEMQKVRYSDVIGMKRAKVLIHKLMELPLIKPKDFEDLNMKKSVGIILYGPPGTGKTYLCKAACGELGLKMSYVTGSSIVSKYVGESAKNIHDLFENARAVQPCGLFFDEADVLLQNRESLGGQDASSNEIKQAVSQMLEETSLIHDDPKACIFMMAATNQPWNIDMAHKRSGRFEFLLYIKAPTFWDRRKLFKLYLTDSAKDHPEKFGNINYTLLALATPDYSPADIERLCKVAKLNAIEKSRVLITTRSVQKALWSKEAGKSSLDDWYLEMYHKYIPKKKSLMLRIYRIIRRKNVNPQEEAKVKFDMADMKLYQPLISDVRRHFNNRWIIWLMRLFGKGLPNYA